MTTTQIQELLNGLMRGIDKKTVVRIETPTDPERPHIVVHLSRDKRAATLDIAEADLVASQTDMMQRNRLRTALKRARDRMWEETRPIFSTKVERQKLEGPGFFRAPQGGRGRR